MIKKLFGILGVLIFGALAFLIGGLFLAHQQIDALNPSLPSLHSIRESARIENLPISIEAINTASQMIKVSGVLEPADETALFEMSFPGFLITWADGRQFLVDAGMTAKTAEAFGKPSESMGAGPMKFHTAIGDTLDFEKLAGIGFTHLHEDHVEGISSLCPGAKDLIIVQGYEQASQTNYGTKAQNLLLSEFECGQRLLIKDNLRLKMIGGFPGLYLVNAAGHTPGSQVFVVHIKNEGRNTTYILAGDLANHFDGISSNIPKPAWYSYLIVPENLKQLELARIWLKELDDQYNIKVLISHHKDSIAEKLNLR